jgi:hypothetical protein
MNTHNRGTKMKGRRIQGLLTVGVVAAAALLVVPQAAYAATSVNDNFEDGVANGFTVATGTYSIVTDGATKVYRTNSAAARSVVGDPASTNTEIQASVKVTSWALTTGQTVGLMTRYTDVNNYYLFIWEDGSLLIRKKVAGTLTTLASTAFTLTTGTWYTFKGKVDGSTLTMSVNGVQMLSTSTTGLTAGRVGLVSFNGDVRYDNVVATDVASNSTLDPFGIKKLNASVGKQWFNVWGNGSQRIYNTAGNLTVDPELALANGDQTATIFGNTGTRSGQMKLFGDYPRVYVRKNESFSTPPGISAADKWNNVEITFYAYSTGDSGVGWAGLEAVAKTNHWPDDWQCTSAGYGARMLFDGRVDFEKELYHSPNTNFEAGSISNYWTGAEGSVGGKLPLNRWIGFKFIARNIDAGNDGNWQNDTQVKLELYKEMSIGNVTNPTPPANGGNWVLVTQYTDTGNLSIGDQYAPCTHTVSPDDDPYGAVGKALTNPNYAVYLRTDGLSSSIPQYYKWFSVREVAPIPAP